MRHEPVQERGALEPGEDPGVAEAAGERDDDNAERGRDPRDGGGSAANCSRSPVRSAASIRSLAVWRFSGGAGRSGSALTLASDFDRVAVPREKKVLPPAAPPP